MAQKISNKNLHYDQTLPPFLARLRDQHNAAIGDGPDPLLAAHRRAAKPRDQAAIDEDAPVIVDEEGNVVAVGTMTVGVDGTVTRTAKGEVEEERDEDEEKEEREKGDKQEKEKQGGGMIGGKRKRKVGKIVGADDEEEVEGEDVENTTKTPTASKRKSDGDVSKVTASKKTDAVDKAKNGGASKGKKKAKRIKLSFGDDDDGD